MYSRKLSQKDKHDALSACASDRNLYYRIHY
jgi:hypothetical protein